MRIVSREFLPSDCRCVHAASMCVHPDGHPVYAWFEGDREGAPYTFIRVYNLHGNGKSIKFGGSSNDAMPRWNPVLFTHNGRVYMFSKIGEFCDRWQTLFNDLTNLGESPTLTELNENTKIIPAGLNGCVKTKPISFGEYIVCGSSVETPWDWSSYLETYALESEFPIPLGRSNPITIPKPRLQTESGSYLPYSKGIIQPAMWRIDLLTVGLLFRSSTVGNHVVYQARAHLPMQWYKGVPKISGTRETDIPNPNSSVDVCSNNDSIFIACNPVENGRLPLKIIEKDNQFVTKNELVITEEVSGECYSNEASYPFMLMHGQDIHLVYTYGRSEIEHVTISIS